MRSIIVVLALCGCISTTTHNVHPSELFVGGNTVRDMDGSAFEIGPDSDVTVVLASGRRLTGTLRELHRHGGTWAWRGAPIDPKSVVMVRIDEDEISLAVLGVVVLFGAFMLGGLALVAGG